MKIVGVNLGETLKGMRLNDGGACLIDEEGFLCIAEERVSRRKYDSGFEKSLNYCLEARGYKMNDIDMFVISSCCEEPRSISDLANIGLPINKVHVIQSHHLSHAYSTFMTSTFEESIIMVLDNEGTMIKDLGKEEFYLVPAY